MVDTEGCEMVTWSKSQKVNLSSDWSLQLDSMKAESLVIADQHAAVNTFPGFVHTARHTMGADSTRRRSGSRRGTCGWITSFLRKLMMWLSGHTQLKGHGFGSDLFLEAFDEKFDDFTLRMRKGMEMRVQIPIKNKK